MRIAIDMDEVIADTAALKQGILADLGHEISRDEARGREFKELVPEAIANDMARVMHTGLPFARADVIDGAVDALRTLTQTHEVFIATAAMEYPASCSHKIAWMERHFPFIDRLNFVFCGDKSILKADVLIDDHTRHFDGFAGQGVCFTAHHNLDETPDYRLDHWSDAPALLERIEGDRA